MPAIGSRRRLRPQQRRELILDSALRVFAECGYHAASVSEIARGAGTTKAVVYDHFATKRALYDAVVAAELAQVLERVARLPREGAPRERLREFADLFLAYVQERPHARRVMFETVDAEPDLGREQRANQQAATRAIAALLADQEERLAQDAAGRSVQLEMIAQMLKSAVNGLADWWADRPDVPRDVAADALTDFLLGGLAAFLPEDQAL